MSFLTLCSPTISIHFHQFKLSWDEAHKCVKISVNLVKCNRMEEKWKLRSAFTGTQAKKLGHHFWIQKDTHNSFTLGYKSIGSQASNFPLLTKKLWGFFCKLLNSPCFFQAAPNICSNSACKGCSRKYRPISHQHCLKKLIFLEGHSSSRTSSRTTCPLLQVVRCFANTENQALS